jgi:hypothetical protein
MKCKRRAGSRREKQMQPIYTVIQVYRAIWKRGHASHLRPAIGTMSRNTILSSAYHCLEPKKKAEELRTYYYVLISVSSVSITKQTKASISSPYHMVPTNGNSRLCLSLQTSILASIISHSLAFRGMHANGIVDADQGMAGDQLQIGNDLIKHFKNIHETKG